MKMVDVSKIEKIMLLMAKHDFDVVEAHAASEKISLARRVSQAGVFHPGPSHGSSHRGSSSFSSHPSSSESSDGGAHGHSLSSSATESSSSAKPVPAGEVVTSPFVGTFYRAPSPDTPHFVEVGSRVKKGQSLCIVEAMKLMNEIESEFDGEVVAILVENAKPVEFGTPLFVIAPSK
jgi:acetyl-CoA carboxylase biotin carboxyl carrier protein